MPARLTALRWPELDADVRKFFRALGPATVGSMGVQLALFADTIIASFLPAGALSALYYADRIDQLPIGVIGIAAGTVILPEMARRIAAGDEAGAASAQNRAIEFTLLLSIPCLAAFFVIPELIMRALFMRGAFTAADAVAAGRTLTAYAFGLLPFVLIRSTVATFFARGDTATPVKAALIAAAVNIAFKFLLMGPLAQVGLALATSIGAWINLGLVVWFAARAGHIHIDERLRQSTVKLAAAGHRAGRGAVAMRGAGRASVCGLASAARCRHPGAAGRDRRRRLWWHRIGAVRRALACRIPRPAARLTQGSLKRSLPIGPGGHNCFRTLWGPAALFVVGRFRRYS